MKVILSGLGGGRRKLITLLLHSSANSRADWLRFGHWRDTGLGVGGDVGWDG